MPLSENVVASGVNLVDSLLGPRKWSLTSLTFSFPDSPLDYDPEYPIPSEPDSGFEQFNAAQMDATRFILGMYSLVANITFSEAAAVDDADAVLRFAMSDAVPTARAYFPDEDLRGGDSWYHNSGGVYDAPIIGTYAFQTIIHEVGHALGLKHPFDDVTGTGETLPVAWDALEFTVMSYSSYAGAPRTGYVNEPYGYPQTLMMLDILALQYLYGANYDTQSGDTVYAWSSTTGELSIDGVTELAPGDNRVFLTVWDGAGEDTYDFSDYSTGVEVDLAPGSWSVTSLDQLAYLGGGQFALGNVYNALLFDGDLSSIIENAIGGSADDLLVGNQVSNRLEGRDGNDVIFGQAGNDVMIGGLGDDIYDVDSAADVVTENVDEGIDQIQTALASYSLAALANVENLLGYSASAQTLTGNALDNAIFGGAAGDTLNGGDGNDYLDGGEGSDKLRGGIGDDAYVVDRAGDQITELAGEGDDEVQSSVTYTLVAELETLFLTGADAIDGTGNSGANAIVGNAAANTLNGAGGADTMFGEGGNDTYFVDDPGDLAIEEAGEGEFDQVRSSVTFSLGANVERLTLLGALAIDATGNALANVITGNSAANRLDGGVGADKLVGKGGDDVYVIERASDKIVEDGGGGTDTAESSVTYTLPTNVEHLALTGTSAINANGNALANILTGNGAVNSLDGLAGADTMIGGGGNDIYFIDNIGDQAVETAGGGTDLVNAKVSFTLGDEVENLTLKGGLAINATGNGLANVIKGNTGANLLNGGGGADKLTGGSGADGFVFDSALGAGNVDRILDFLAGTDEIRLDDAIFTTLAVGALSAAALRIGTAATTADHRIVYDPATGNLFYDSDGVGGAAQTLFAILDPRPATLATGDFAVI